MDQEGPEGKGSISLKGNTLYWDMEPDQLAYRFPENFLMQYEGVGGIYVPPGVQALVTDGTSTEVLTGGVHPIQAPKARAGAGRSAGKPDSSPGLLARLFRKGRPESAGDPMRKATGKRSARGVPGPSVTLARTGSFRLNIRLSEMEIGMHNFTVTLGVVARIVDLKTLHEELMADRRELTPTALAREAALRIQRPVHDLIQGKSYAELKESTILARMESELSPVFNRLLELGVSAESVEAFQIGDESEESLRNAEMTLVRKERELEHRIRENDFLRQLASEENRRRLDQARTEEELKNTLAEIDTERVLSDAERERLRRSIEFQRRIDAARSGRELESTLAEIEKSRLLDDQGMADLRAQVESQSTERESILERARLANEHEIERLKQEQLHERDRLRLEQESELEMKRAQAQIARRRLEQEYLDEAERLENMRRSEKQKGKLDILREAQSIRLERESAQHRRERETRAQEIAADQERLRSFASMSPEQIMASNPDIRPEAAEALAKFAEGRNAQEQVTQIREILEARNKEMHSFMGKQLELAKDLGSGRLDASDLQRFLRLLGPASRTETATSSGTDQTGDEKQTACSSCGRSVPVTASFCPYCGVKLKGE